MARRVIAVLVPLREAWHEVSKMIETGTRLDHLEPVIIDAVEASSQPVQALQSA